MGGLTESDTPGRFSCGGPGPAYCSTRRSGGSYSPGEGQGKDGERRRKGKGRWPAHVSRNHKPILPPYGNPYVYTSPFQNPEIVEKGGWVGQGRTRM